MMLKNDFLKNVSNENNHRLLLWHALEMTEGLVVELGSGHGSTPYISKYCADAGREFKTYDSSPEWAQRMSSELVNDWNTLQLSNVSVLLVDHAPGERRKIDIVKYKDVADIIVVHDTEPAADHGYQVRQHFPKFKYIAEVKGMGAWATILSNKLDVRKMIGEVHGKYEVRGYEKA